MITSIEREKLEQDAHRELHRSYHKHGYWLNKPYVLMLLIILGELWEVFRAVLRRDYHGEHGVLNELAQVGACCQKMAVQVMRRQRQP